MDATGFDSTLGESSTSKAYVSKRYAPVCVKEISEVLASIES
jgi:hypothetical protein